MLTIQEFISKIPKAELHLHIEGTFEPELMFEIARRNGVKTRFSSVSEIQAAYQFSNLQTFLDIYYEGAGVLLKECDFYDLTWAYLRKVSSQNVKHVEIFFDPQTHTDRGVEFKEVIEGINHALLDGKAVFGISSKLIMCFLRHLPEENALKTLELATPYLEWIHAVGLDSSESGNPPSNFSRVFAKAQALGLLTVAHAGEEGPPSFIWEALNLLNVQRIDHGVMCEKDPELVKYLALRRIPLTVCPLSNLKLCVVDTLENHNLKRLLDLGLCVTINSDDPAYFGGYIEENYIQTQAALRLTRDDISLLAKNAFEASFLTSEEKQVWIDEINQLSKTN